MMDPRQSSCPTSFRMNNVMSNSTTSARPTPPPILSRKELINKINLYSFAVNDSNLFLDTHPFDNDALAYFQKYRKLRLEAVEEYAKHYAPLVIDHTVDEKTPWSWANEPWPWEGVEC